MVELVLWDVDTKEEILFIYCYRWKFEICSINV